MSPLDLNSFIFFWFINVLRAENKGDLGALFRSLIKYDSSLPGWRVREQRIRRQKCKCPPLKLLTLIIIITVFFWLSFVACTVLVLQPGIEPVSPTVEIWSPNHWTAREFPAHPYF